MSGFLTGVFSILDHTILEMLTIPFFSLVLGFFVFFAVLGIFLSTKDALTGRRSHYDK